MNTIASQITSLTIVYSTVYSGADQRKHQSSASLAFVRGSHRGPVNSPHKGPVTRKMFPFNDVIMGGHLGDHSKGTRTCQVRMAKSMAADGLATPEVRALITMVLTLFSSNIPASTAVMSVDAHLRASWWSHHGVVSASRPLWRHWNAAD